MSISNQAQVAASKAFLETVLFQLSARDRKESLLSKRGLVPMRSLGSTMLWPTEISLVIPTSYSESLETDQKSNDSKVDQAQKS
jgi:hypothetical protein